MLYKRRGANIDLSSLRTESCPRLIVCFYQLGRCLLDESVDLRTLFGMGAMSLFRSWICTDGVSLVSEWFLFWGTSLPFYPEVYPTSFEYVFKIECLDLQELTANLSQKQACTIWPAISSSAAYPNS